MNFFALPKLLVVDVAQADQSSATAALTLALPWLNEPMTTVRSLELGDGEDKTCGRGEEPGSNGCSRGGRDLKKLAAMEIHGKTLG